MLPHEKLLLLRHHLKKRIYHHLIIWGKSTTTQPNTIHKHTIIILYMPFIHSLQTTIGKNVRCTVMNPAKIIKIEKFIINLFLKKQCRVFFFNFILATLPHSILFFFFVYYFSVPFCIFYEYFFNLFFVCPFLFFF